MSFELIVDHVKKTGNIAASKRIGWMLDRIGRNESKELKDIIYRTVIPLDYSIDREGEIDPEWGVIVNIGDIK